MLQISKEHHYGNVRYNAECLGIGHNKFNLQSCKRKKLSKRWQKLHMLTIDPVQVKFECNEVDPFENSRALHILPHNSGTIIDGKKVQVTRIESRS